MKKEKPFIQGITVMGKSVYTLLGRGYVGIGVEGKRVTFNSLTETGKIGSKAKPEYESDENIIFDFVNEKSLDVVMDALKEVKKSFKKPARKKK